MTKINFPNFNNNANDATKDYKEIKTKRISRKKSYENINGIFTKNYNDPVKKKLASERKLRLRMLKDDPDPDVLQITKDCITALNQYLDSFQDGVENLSNKDDFENIVNGLDDDLDCIFDNFDDLNGDIRMMIDLFSELYMQLKEMENQLIQIQTDLGYLSPDSPMYDEDKDKLMHDLSVFRNNLNSVNNRIFPEGN